MENYNLADMFLNNIYLTILLPLWIFLIIMVGRFFSVYVDKKLIHLLSLFSSLIGVIFCGGALLNIETDKVLDVSMPFIKINDFIINFGLYVDRTALIFSLVLFLISFFVLVFSISYMNKDKKTYRFYGLINLFIFTMSSLFFSSNLFQTYFFWELAGVASYLLIGFEYFKKNKSQAAKKVFITNRIGDVALLGAIILCSYFVYSYAPNKTLTTLSFIDMDIISTLVYAYASTPLFETICVMFLIGALVKSAQFPFYTWLQDAMEAKLPVSALLHSSTLVAAGVYLTIRLLPFYSLEQLLLNMIMIVGIITAFVCSISACAQVNPKKVLAYSTSAQLGLIFFAIGNLNIKVAFFLFIAHAFIKSLLFIALPKEEESWSYVKFIVFLLAGLSLSGLIFSGMIVKEMLVEDLNVVLTTLMSIISFLTAFYIIRIALVICENNGLEKCSSKITEWISLLGLLILNIGLYIYLHKTAQYKIAEPFWAALTAWIVVYVLYLKKAFWKVPLIYNLAINGFYLDKLYTEIIFSIYVKFADLCENFDKKVLSNYRIQVLSAKLGVNLFNFIENKIMFGSIDFIKKTLLKLSLLEMKAQNGNIQTYNLYAFLIVTFIMTSLILAYLAVLSYIGG